MQIHSTIEIFYGQHLKIAIRHCQGVFADLIIRKCKEFFLVPKFLLSDLIVIQQ